MLPICAKDSLVPNWPVSSQGPKAVAKVRAIVSILRKSVVGVKSCGEISLAIQQKIKGYRVSQHCRKNGKHISSS